MNKMKPESRPTRGPEYLGIDIDPQGLFVVAGAAGTKSARVEQVFAWVPGEDHGPPPLTVETAKEIGEQLRRKLDAAKFARLPAVVAIGRERVILAEVKYPPVPPAEEPALVRFQAMKVITESGDDVVIDYCPAANGTGTTDPTAERKAAVVAVRKEVFEAVRDMCTAAGLKLAAVTPRPFAVAAALSQAIRTGDAPAPENPDDPLAVLTLGPQGGEFTVTRGGQVSFTRAVPAPVLSNEALLLGEVKRNLTVFAGQNPGHPVRAVYVAEAEDLLGGWAGRLRPGLPVPVHAFDPLAGSPAAVPEKLRGRYAGAAGLLAGQAAGLPINFAAPRQPRVAANPQRTLLTIAGAAAVLLLLVGGVFGYMALDTADRELADKQAEKAALEKYVADWEPDRKRLEAADQWEARGVNYLEELDDMSDRLPAGDQLRVIKFDGKAAKVDKNGKQNHQAEFTLLVGGKTLGASSQLMSEMERDNTKTARYYVGTGRTIGGLATGATPHKQLATIHTWVNHRPPAGYTRSPSFTPPRRGAAPAPPPADDAKTPAEPVADPTEEE